MVEKIVWIFLQLIGKLIIVVLSVSLFLEVACSVKKFGHSFILSNIFDLIDELSPKEYFISFQIGPALMFVSLVENDSCEFRHFVDFFIIDSQTPFFFIWASSQINQESELWEKFSFFITEWSVIVRLEVSTTGTETVQSENMIDTVEVVK